MNTLYVLHEHGAPRHFEAITYLNNEKKLYDRVIHLEFAVIHQFVKGIVKRKPKLLFKSLYNVMHLLFFLFSRDKKIVIGAAPFDIFVYYLLALKKRHDIIYYSSWPYWDGSFHPRKILIKHQQKMWREFLDNTKVVAVTSAVKDGLVSFTDQVTVIPHCINPDIFHSHNRKEDNFRVIYVGRILEQKGIKLILELIQEIKMDIDWWFVGEGDEELKKQIRKLEAGQDNVKYFGSIKDQNKLAELYRSSQILLLPSYKTKGWEELFGIVIIEAMASGVIPISTNAIGPNTIITDSLNGYLIEQGDKKAIKERILKLYRDRDYSNKMSAEAGVTVERNYTIASTAKLWEEVLNSSELENDKKAVSTN
ncbi:glycosyltransferase [Aquibacillus halophilus]|uniref:Glycosyltransferase n=1 Tax=Aquibacillus halophilus TaxID=930132 RepID=A0A6A8D6D7_9BACI|nr:glycosyltransferase family 4 protein [Aquibacillus halophilus]MRH41303.1 glycosyltransferase [Aquibacillus halophilus]